MAEKDKHPMFVGAFKITLTTNRYINATHESDLILNSLLTQPSSDLDNVDWRLVMPYEEEL